jgi:hypothetical protein
MEHAPPSPQRKIRCYTRAMKNARYLQQQDPAAFAQDKNAQGFGTGVPMEILQVLHRLNPDSPELKNHAHLSEFVKKHRVPGPEGWKPIIQRYDSLCPGYIRDSRRKLLRFFGRHANLVDLCAARHRPHF